jgi:hypothetical protein
VSLVFLTDGQVALTSPAGQVEKIDFRKGDVKWRPASRYSTENVTDHAIQVVEVQLRDKPLSPPPVLSKLDPLTVDPQHYKLEWENERVRVLRVRFGPMEKGQLHEHTFSNVVVYLNDQARGKLGEARMDGPRTHSEENPLDRSVERVSVDLK